MDTPQGKHVWTAKVGEKGQIVIPKEAREIFRINPGDTLVLLGDENQGIAIVRQDMLIRFAEAVLKAPQPEEDDQ
jgi:AbrB family looped-hinge helix DNA binding protein